MGVSNLLSMPTVTDVLVELWNRLTIFSPVNLWTLIPSVLLHTTMYLVTSWCQGIVNNYRTYHRTHMKQIVDLTNTSSTQPKFLGLVLIMPHVDHNVSAVDFYDHRWEHFWWWLGHMWILHTLSISVNTLKIHDPLATYGDDSFQTWLCMSMRRFILCTWYRRPTSQRSTWLSLLKLARQISMR